MAGFSTSCDQDRSIFSTARWPSQKYLENGTFSLQWFGAP